MARYRIAVCDDEPPELGDIVQCVKRYDVHGDFDIENYADGAVLLSDLQLKKKSTDGAVLLSDLLLKKKSFDLLLLDIEMPSNGFQMAQTLTQMEKHPLVIFVTKRHEYAVQGYGIAFRYLVKPLDESLFSSRIGFQTLYR
ncbi:LytR/AlgR family response regulator transcription factor [Faecalibacterium prausnitzii]|uniref:LytR/AlgR family response regulator transcription factor n=1 Tax=Faecalibacterium prausnitzii TaxID=853 RepID=UPI0022E524D8|nr:response regulator [Faecalibacterium prausnitzii]